MKSRLPVPWLAVGVSVLLHIVLLASVLPVQLHRAPVSAAAYVEFVAAVVIKHPAETQPLKSSEPAGEAPDPVKTDIQENSGAIVSEKNPEKLAPKVPEAAPATPGTRDVIAEAANIEEPGEEVFDTERKVFVPYYKVDQKPRFVHRAPLEYPSQARRKNIEGTVILEADIDERGNIADIRIIRPAGFGFDESAVKMIAASSFEPASSGGRSVAVRMRFTISFRLK